MLAVVENNEVNGVVVIKDLDTGISRNCGAVDHEYLSTIGTMIGLVCKPDEIFAIDRAEEALYKLLKSCNFDIVLDEPCKINYSIADYWNVKEGFTKDSHSIMDLILCDMDSDHVFLSKGYLYVCAESNKYQGTYFRWKLSEDGARRIDSITSKRRLLG